MKTRMLAWAALALFLFGCAATRDMTPEEQEAIRKSNERYYQGQRGGP